MTTDDTVGRIKSAASFILKGGTLTREPCPNCGGVQVRFEGKVTCINCGNESVERDGKTTKTINDSIRKQSKGLETAALLIEEKIGNLAAEIKNETDVSAQKQMAELLEIFLRILEKTKSLLE